MIPNNKSYKNRGVYLRNQAGAFYCPAVWRKKTETGNSYGSNPVKSVFERMDAAMKRKFLEDLGLEKETVDKIMAENGKDIETAKGELDAITTERDNLKKDVSDRDKQIDDLKKSAGSNEDLKKQIEALQAENKAAKLNNAVEKALTAAKALNLTAAKALLKDLDKAELAEDGTVKGLDEQIKALQKGEDTKFLFAAESKTPKNKLTGASPAEPDDKKPSGITKEQFARMSYKEKLGLFNSDRETYNLLTGKTTEADE